MLRMRWLLAIAAIVGGGAALAAPGGAYTSPAYHFMVTPPAGWVAKQNKDAIVVFKEPQAQTRHEHSSNESNEEFLKRIHSEQGEGLRQVSFRADITLTVLKPSTGYTLEEYARETRRRAASMKMYRILRERAATLGGAEAIDRTVRITLADGSTTMNRETFCVRNGSVFTIALAAPAGSFQHYESMFDALLSSFKWTS